MPVMTSPRAASICCLILLLALIPGASAAQRVEETAEFHHQLGVAYAPLPG